MTHTAAEVRKDNSVNADGTGLDGPDAVAMVASVLVVVGVGAILYAAWRWSVRHADEQRRLHEDAYISDGRLSRLREEGL